MREDREKSQGMLARAARWGSRKVMDSSLRVFGDLVWLAGDANTSVSLATTR